MAEKRMEISRKKRATQFENKIKDLLTKLEFNDVDGARDNFLVNGVQVDVCGGWENALLVIECKDKREIGVKNLRSVIGEFRGKIPLLRKGFAEDPRYSKYTYLKFILVTRNVEVRKVDLEYANENPSIYIWDDNFLEYYSNLYSYLKPYAKYDLLGEMRIRPVQSAPISVPALQTSFGGVNVYSFLINPKDLLEVAFVARREIGRERFYQRIIQEERLKKISEYIEAGGKFANNIIISFDEAKGVSFKKINGDGQSNDWKYKDVAFGVLQFPKDYRSCWVIDGQHRLYSFASLKNDFYFNMPVTAFEHLELKEQRKFFLDINKNQKPVDPDLLWDLSSDVPTEKEGIIASVAKNLNMDRGSPLRHLIYYPSTGISEKKNKIKISALCIAMKRARIANDVASDSVKNPLYAEEYGKRISLMSRSLSHYFWVLKECFPENWGAGTKGFLLTNGGIAVMISLFSKIVSRVMQRTSKEPKDYEFRQYLLPLKAYFEGASSGDLKALRLRCASEGGRKELLNEFCLKIRTTTKDDLFGGEISVIKFGDEFLDLEKRLKELIRLKLESSSGDNWFQKIADPNVYRQATSNLAKVGLTDQGKVYLQIGLGQCIGLLEKYSEIFYPIFISEESESSFSNKKIFEGALSHIATMRVKLGAHHTGSRVKSHDEDLLRGYLSKINKCIDDELAK